MKQCCKKTIKMNVTFTDEERKSLEDVSNITNALLFNAHCNNVNDFIDAGTGEVFETHELMRATVIIEMLLNNNGFELN